MTPTGENDPTETGEPMASTTPVATEAVAAAPAPSLSPSAEDGGGPEPGNAAPAEATAAPAEAPSAAVARAYDEDEEDNIGNRVGPPPQRRGPVQGLAPQVGQAIVGDDAGDEPAADEDGPQPGNAAPEPGNEAPGHRPAGAGRNRPDKRRQSGPQQTQGGHQGPRTQSHGGGQGPGGHGHRHGGDFQNRAFHAGDKVRARVVALGEAGALVDLWGKEQAVLDLRELATPDGPPPALGDSVDVIVLQDGARGGNLVVTRDVNRFEHAREFVAQAFNAGEPVEGLITGFNKGGLEVDVSGLRAFCPTSHVDVRALSQPELQALLLKRELFTVTQLQDGGREAIVSRRSLREAQVRERATEAVQKIKVGDRVTGRVVAVKDHGIFVDLGGVEGRIQLSELSHDRGARPQDIAKVGDEIEALVLRIDTTPALPPAPKTPHEGRHSDHAEHPDHGAPHEPTEAHGEHAEAHADAPADASMQGEPSERLEGAEPSEHAEHPEHLATAEHAEGAPKGEAQHGRGERHDRGDRHDRNDRNDRNDPKGSRRPRFSRLPEGTPRVELSRRAVEKDPWSDVPRRYPVNSVHKGKVARMQPFGAFIELERGVDGLLHVSEIGDKRLNHPNEVLKDHQEVTVRVLKIDTKARRIALGMLPEGVTEEQLKAAPQIRVGLVAMAKVIEHESIGVWAQLDGAFGKNGRGLILPADSNIPKGQDLRKALPVGKEVRVKVVEMDRGRLRLSIRAVLQDEERAAYRAYQQQATSTTVGTSLADKLKKLNLAR